MDVWFNGASFDGDADFGLVIFGGPSFGPVPVDGPDPYEPWCWNTSFDEATFCGDVNFGGAKQGQFGSGWPLFGSAKAVGRVVEGNFSVSLPTDEPRLGAIGFHGIPGVAAGDGGDAGQSGDLDRAAAIGGGAITRARLPGSHPSPDITTGHHIGKGEELGYFQFGGSTHCLIFRPGAIVDFHLTAVPRPGDPHAPLVKVRSKLAAAARHR